MTRLRSLIDGLMWAFGYGPDVPMHDAPSRAASTLAKAGARKRRAKQDQLHTRLAASIGREWRVG